MSARRGIFVAPFDELADPRLLARLAAEAEERGFDGFFLWDHVNYRPPTSALADPWVALAAVADATERVLIGPLVTPLSRRRVHKLARETVTLDLLSGGRTVFGVGLGSDNNGELEPFGEVVDPRERARLLDDGLDRLVEFWGGEFEPRPLQRPRIPVWVAARWPNTQADAPRRALGRSLPDRSGGAGAARGDGGVRERAPPGRRYALRGRRRQSARHGPGALGGGGRHLVPHRVRRHPSRGRGAGRDRRRPRLAR